MFEYIKKKAYTAYDAIKAWFKRSWTILLARATVLAGLVTAAVAQMDWSPLWTSIGTGTDFNWKQLSAIAISVVAGGLVLELAKRSKAV